MQAIPKVNINGTSQKALEDECRRAWDALDNAISAIWQMDPHKRDFPLESDYKAARAQHVERLRLVTQVKDEIMEIWEGVAAQRR